ncbi:MAG: hypothetical protein J0M04_18470 [Verrucomicrobia bacterium]|nr:hypothetical protein [Verrucomicrobiota bacterium]
MNLRPTAEILVVLAVVGIALEIADGHTWTVIAAGVFAAIWLLNRTH